MTREEIKQTYSMKDILVKCGLPEPNRAGFIKCPFHKGDHEASMKVYDKDFHCFGCGANGDIFTFIEKFYGISFKDAFLMLRRDADARILDSQYGFLTHAADRHHHLPAFPIILDRVIAEIIADLREQALDAAKSQRLTAKGQTDLSLLRRIRQRIRRLTRDLRKIADLKR